MSDPQRARLAALEPWSPSLFLAAGVLFVGHAALRAVEAFTAMPTPVDVFGPLGYVAAVLGLAGLYPTLADRAPGGPRLAAGAAAVAGLAWTAIAAWSVGEAAGVLPPQSTVVPTVAFLAVIVLTLCTYLLFGVAGHRTDALERPVGPLLLVPAGLFGLLLVAAPLLPVSAAVGGVVVGIGQALAHGAIGGTLLVGRPRSDHAPAAGGLRAE